MSARALQNWELGQQSPTLRFVPRIVQFLGYVPGSSAPTPGERLKASRRADGAFQLQIARALGIDKQLVSDWERGRHPLTEERLREIQSLLGKLLINETD